MSKLILLLFAFALAVSLGLVALSPGWMRHPRRAPPTERTFRRSCPLFAPWRVYSRLRAIRCVSKKRAPPADSVGAPNCTEVEKMSAGRGAASCSEQATRQDSARRLLPPPKPVSSFPIAEATDRRRNLSKQAVGSGSRPVRGVVSHDQRHYAGSTISPRFLYASVSLPRGGSAQVRAPGGSRTRPPTPGGASTAARAAAEALNRFRWLRIAKGLYKRE
jgi:hypothetical protein